jgi:CMP-N-acetylneuraminic acid synthetase
MKPITAFLPCRKGSQRIPNKNLRPFAQYEFGLLQIKIAQLAQCYLIKEIIVSTNDENVKAVVSNFKNAFDGINIIIDDRPDYLGTSDTSTDEVISYVGDKFEFEHLLWTHVTSPFVDTEDYVKCIEHYFSALERGHDSLMTVQTIKGFIWNETQPINYDKLSEKWPRTQTLSPLFEVDSAAFIAPKAVYKTHNDRIGLKPFLLDLEKEVNIDIDWPQQFNLAECIFKIENA